MTRPAQSQENSALWTAATTRYMAANGVDGDAWRASMAATETARATSTPPATANGVQVDLFVDPVCPYTWLAAGWLQRVRRSRDVTVTYHPMSLRMLNEHRTMDVAYQRNVDRSAGPSRVATAVWNRYGPTELRRWHTAFGTVIFDHWRYPSAREYRAAAVRALKASGLPSSLADAADDATVDEPLRESHTRAIARVGSDGGTPIVHFNGHAFFGPVLNEPPSEKEGLALFDGLVLVSQCDSFFELKRTRTSPPHFAAPSSTAAAPTETQEKNDGR